MVHVLPIVLHLRRRLLIFDSNEDQDGITATGHRRVSHHVWVLPPTGNWVSSSCLSKFMRLLVAVFVGPAIFRIIMDNLWGFLILLSGTV